MGVEGRATARDVKSEVQSLAGRCLGHLLFHVASLLDRDPVLLGQARGAFALALGRCRRIEFEASPGHAHIVAMLELRERGLEPALSDVAPRTRDVRPDFDVHERHSLVESATNPSVAGVGTGTCVDAGPYNRAAAR